MQSRYQYNRCILCVSGNIFRSKLGKVGTRGAVSQWWAYNGSQYPSSSFDRSIVASLCVTGASWARLVHKGLAANGGPTMAPSIHHHHHHHHLTVPLVPDTALSDIFSITLPDMLVSNFPECVAHWSNDAA